MAKRYSELCVVKTKPIVCVIEPDKAVRQAMVSMLSTLGVEVKGFQNAEGLLDEAADLELDCACVVAEIELPGMSGLQIVHALRRRGYHVPVILLTSDADVALAVDAVRSGAFDFIEKPFVDRTLLQRVRVALDLESAHHQAPG